MSQTVSIDEALKLAVQHHQAGEFQQAGEIYCLILDKSPRHPDALHLLGLLTYQIGRARDGAELISRAIAQQPAIPAYHSNLAEALRAAGQLDDAINACRQAIALQPGFSSAHANLGIILNEKGQLDEAESSLRTALQIDPKMTTALISLANVLKNKGQLDGALEIAQRTVSESPNHPWARNTLGTVLQAMGTLPEAEAEYRHAIELDPRFAEAMDNLGNLHRRQRNMAAAIELWRHALTVNPHYVLAEWNLALGLLATGDFERGWPMYECRLRTPQMRQYLRGYPSPRWSGSDLAGKTILIYPEQGYGDVIQFARFLPELKSRGATVLFELPAELIELMKNAHGIDRIIGPDESLPAFDTHQTLLSLPFALKTTLKTLPAKVPYIHVDPSRKARWSDRMRSQPGKLKVGLDWSGRSSNTENLNRSVPPEMLTQLGEVPDVAYFSLQRDPAGDIPIPIIDVGTDLKDFADTAAAIANLDLLITIDTAAAHLAGAMGARVWTLLPFAADYRWMLDRDDSPWYPTMRLFRQTRANDWTDVVQRVRDELLNLVKD